MTPNQSLSLQTFILGVLRAGGKTGVPEERLLAELRREGFENTTAPELTALLRSAADKSWVTSFEPPLGAKRWRITALGESILQEQGI